jgi:hypothetical protein
MGKILSTFLNKFSTFIQNMGKELLELSNAINNMEFELQNIETTTQKLQISEKEPIDSTVSLDEIKKEVPELLNRLKVIMGTDKDTEFSDMSVTEKKQALKDMENAIRILTEEYDKISTIEEK